MHTTHVILCISTKAVLVWEREKAKTMEAEGPDYDRDLEALIAKLKKERLQVERTWEKFENLEAAIESAKEANDKSKSLMSASLAAASERKLREQQQQQQIRAPAPEPDREPEPNPNSNPDSDPGSGADRSNSNPGETL